jgi:fructose-bisphosphate aldolase class II
MTLIPLKSLLADATRRRYALPAFNAYNLESTQAVLDAAERARSPVILQYSHTTLTTWASPEALAGMALPLLRASRVPACLHYDHGKTPEMLERCFRAGFSSGMLDASRLAFSENVRLSERAVAIAHKHRGGAEVEIGRLAGREEWVAGERGEYTDPLEAGLFAELVNPDALAISVGSVHGQSQKKFRLDFSLLEDLAGRVHGVPLVLHGSSGVPDSDLRRAVRLGIRKVNMNTVLRHAFTRGVRDRLARDRKAWDPMDYLGAGREQMARTGIQRMRVLGSAGKA